jgi:plasmid stabilization system protein ParE
VYSVIFAQAARADLIAAKGWYEGEATGPGRRFRQAIDALVEPMSENPRQFPIVFKNVRRHWIADRARSHRLTLPQTKPAQREPMAQMRRNELLPAPPRSDRPAN